MVHSLLHLLFWGAVVDAAAISSGYSLKSRATVNTTALPIGEANTTARAEAIDIKREGWGYGPSKLGSKNSFYPNGTLGAARSTSDQAAFVSLETAVEDLADADLNAVENATAGGLNTIDDYNLLYDGQWLNSVPDGIDAGLMTNYTDDLLFSMSRLTVNPYVLTRLDPSNTTLPFDVDADTVLSVAGEPLASLLASGSLFYADHSYQSAYPTTSLYTAFCSAYFYINSTSGDLMPLAIKTNIGSDLVYTPLDTANDWMLAKIMFNQNDVFHAQMYHVSNSHSPAEIVYESAIRTLSDDHPLLAILDRVMYQAYAIRPQGELVLFAEGGLIDTYFGLTHVGAETLIDDFYPTGGAFVGQYLENEVASRCLVNCAYGPALKSYPYYEDALVLQTALKAFFTVMIESYYTSDTMVSEDQELQNWLIEANGPAEVIDFPTEATNTTTVIEIMTHMAFLTGVQHHVLNTGAPVHAGAILPFRPLALFAEPPTAKNVTDLMPYLTPLEYAIASIELLTNFNRPTYPALNLTLEHMFNNSTLLERLNDETVAAAAVFQQAMKAQADVISARSFDADGLSQGAPFIYKQLNPATMPFFLTV